MSRQNTALLLYIKPCLLVILHTSKKIKMINKTVSLELRHLNSQCFPSTSLLPVFHLRHCAWTKLSVKKNPAQCFMFFFSKTNLIYSSWPFQFAVRFFFFFWKALVDLIVSNLKMILNCLRQLCTGLSDSYFPVVTVKSLYTLIHHH